MSHRRTKPRRRRLLFRPQPIDEMIQVQLRGTRVRTYGEFVLMSGGEVGKCVRVSVCVRACVWACVCMRVCVRA